ncbi:GTP 3',8-cyclase MoaA [Angelakisella massiliensis]|uniref:GTP 3',8-cyclase MoaA n=1 Tax=Angelakisella massiliensis TaxID=1871018 RepID=UPI0008F812CB|nr:GTP 3',8-cyclase MoaA [Angelakisella massiliensis]
MLDRQNRTIDYLRISVTDKCNLRCTYCMPADGVEDLTHEEVLSFEEILRVVKAMVPLGVKKIKLTGGEPLVRKNLVYLVEQLHQLPGIEDITMTTNGLLLEENLPALLKAGLTAVNISLDTLDPDRFRQITRREGLDKVLSALDAASRSSLRSVKINCLAVKEFNEEELPRLALLAKDREIEVRFIELMPIGFGKTLTPIPNTQILETLEQVYGKSVPYEGRLGNGPAVYYQLPGFQGKIGFISAVSHRFCSQCNRVRLTSSGFLKLCLHYNNGIELRPLLRDGISDHQLTETLREAIYNKPLHHSFDGVKPEGEDDQLELKNMSQIGG